MPVTHTFLVTFDDAPQDSAVQVRNSTRFEVGFLALKRPQIPLSTHVRQRPFSNLMTLFDTQKNIAVETANAKDKGKEENHVFSI